MFLCVSCIILRHVAVGAYTCQKKRTSKQTQITLGLSCVRGGYTHLQFGRCRHTATHYNTLQHTATHCNTLRHTATHCDTLQHNDEHGHTCNLSAVDSCFHDLCMCQQFHFALLHFLDELHMGCCSVLRCVAVCCSVLQCVAVCCSVLQCVAMCCNVSLLHFLQNLHMCDMTHSSVCCDSCIHTHHTLQHSATHSATLCNTLQHTCNTLDLFSAAREFAQGPPAPCSALSTDCNTLDPKICATTCNTLQHPATPCNTLQHQHPATPCNTLLLVSVSLKIA